MATTQPDPFRPHLVECRKLIEAGKSGEAAARIKSVLDVKRDHPDANYLMGIACAHLNDREGAIAHLERSNTARPDTPMVMNELARVYERGRQNAEALALQERLLSLHPNAEATIDLHCRRGIALAKLRRFEEAATAFREVTAQSPDYTPAWHNLGNVLANLEDREGAVAAFRKAAQLDPNSPIISYGLGRALLWLEQYTESIDCLSRAMAGAPHEYQMLSYKILALRYAGRNEEADELEGINDMILKVHVPPPPEFGSLEEWNDVLRDEIVSHPALTREFENRATRNGAKVDFMFAKNKTPIFELFERQVRASFEETVARMPKKPNHPLPLTVPNGYFADMWSNVMYDQGHQMPHNHPKGWFSACYYNVLPDRVTASGDAHEGWIEFGGTAYDFPEPPDAPKRQFQPEPGLMVVFPSYLFHRTIPFSSDQIRISCAFDAKPHGWKHT